MDIKKPPALSNPTAAALQAPEKLAEAVPAKALEQMTDMEKHVAGFVNIPMSKDKGELIVSASSTQEVLQALGIRVHATGVFDVVAPRVDKLGGELLTGLFAKNQGHKDPRFVQTTRLAEVGVRDTREGIRGDTGMFDKKTGMIDAQKAASWWVATTHGKDHMTLDDIKGYLDGPGHDVGGLGLISLHKPGKALNALELTLLFDLAAQVDSKGQRVLTPDRFMAFLDGSMWRDLAQARLEGKLYEPVKIGAATHGSAGKVASEIAKLTAAYGGPTDAGTMALHQAKLSIDTEASLKYQQSEKTLLPTILGAVRTLCPVGGAAGLQKSAAVKATGSGGADGERQALTRIATEAAAKAAAQGGAVTAGHPLLERFGESLGMGLGVVVTEALALVPSWNKPVLDENGKPVMSVEGASRIGDHDILKRHEEVVGPKVAALVEKLSPGAVHDLLEGLGKGATAAPGTSYRIEASVADALAGLSSKVKG